MTPPERGSKPPFTHLAAAEAALRYAQKPLTSKQIVDTINQLEIAKITGATPHKTINARLSEDIAQKGSSSTFVRTAQGRFSLRGLNWEPEVTVKPRSIAPLEEDIKVVHNPELLAMLSGRSHSKLYDIDRTFIVSCGKTMRRSEAEQRTDVVQLIPCFVVQKNNSVLSFQRTKRLPEARLHHSKSINFGGHLQADDFPELFSDNQSVVDLFLMRELHEELAFSKQPSIEFLGGLYLQNTPFERQHLGIVYLVSIDDGTEVVSVEPGYHTNLDFEPSDVIIRNVVELDSWSQVLAEEIF